MYSVVIVDDDKLSEKIISECIENNNTGFNVAGCFDNPQTALEYLHKNYIDLLITDIVMPEMSGIELIETVKKINPNCRFIIVSGCKDFDCAKRAIENKVENYLIKPMGTEELLASLKNIKNKLDIDSEMILNLKEEKERKELFLNSVISDSISLDELKKEFLKLKFSFGYENSDGYLFVVDIKNFNDYVLKNWKYGPDSIMTAFENIFKTCLKTKEVYTVAIEENKFIFICFCNNIGEQKINICLEFEEILKIDTEVLYETFFDNISDALNLKNAIGKINGFEITHMDNININKEAFINDSVIKKAAEYINENYASDITRDEVAKITHLSSSYFSTYFKSKTGIKFCDYLLFFRISKAIEMLKNGENSKDIYARVGYNDVRFFNRKFKEFTSYTVVEYRKNLLKNEVSV